MNATTYNHEILPKFVVYVYVKIKKFQECAFMRLYSVKQNIEGDANLQHPPEIGLTLFELRYVYPLFEPGGIASRPLKL